MLNGRLVAAFGYERVIFTEGDIAMKGMLHVERLEEGQWLDELRKHLQNAATLLYADVPRRLREWHYPDNKETFLWLESNHTWHLAMWYDGAFSHIKWGVRWGENVPANIWTGHQLVAAAVKKYHVAIKEEKASRRLASEVAKKRNIDLWGPAMDMIKEAGQRYGLNVR